MSEPIPYDVLYDLTVPPLMWDVQLSPHGEYAAFVAAEFDPEEEERLSSVFVVPTDGSREPHRLTRASTASAPQWSPDGSSLAVLAARKEDVERRVGREDETSEGEQPDDEQAEEQAEEEPETGPPGDEPLPQVWVYDLELGGDARQVTDFDEGAREFDWSPDGERLVVAARDPTEEQAEYLARRRQENGPIETERLQHKADGVGWLDDVTTYLFVVDAETGETDRLDDAYGAGSREAMLGLQPNWSPDGTRIAFVSNRTERPDDSNVMDLYTISPDGENLKKVTDSDVMASAMEWSPEGSQLAFVSWGPENFYTPAELQVADIETAERRSLSADLDRTVSLMHGVRWLDDEQLVACIGDEGLSRPVVFGADGDKQTRAFPTQGRDRELAAFDVRDGTFVTMLSDPTDGADLYVTSTEGLFEETEPTRLTALNEEFVESHHTPRAERITVDNGEGDTVEAIVYLPEEFDPDDPEAHAAIMSIHGGPMSYDAPQFGFETACWTSRGYLVVKPNYRGSTSYGREFCETLRGRWGTDEVVDQRACAEALVERGWIDPERLFATGFSYGGISTAYLVTQTDLFTAAAPEHGIYDLRSVFSTGDFHTWFESDFGLPWEDEGTYAEHSSITDVDSITTPLLITAGGQDWRTPPTQAEQLYVSVRKQGVPAKLVIYPDEHHNLQEPDRRLHRIEELTSWFERFDPAVETENEN